jgi:hypothetical protein
MATNHKLCRSVEHARRTARPKREQRFHIPARAILSLLTLSSRAIYRNPFARKVATFSRSTNVFGRPSFFPCRLARSSPIITRSRIKLRSSSATAPMMVKIILPIGVEVSMGSFNETKSISSAVNSSSARTRCREDKMFGRAGEPIEPRDEASLNPVPHTRRKNWPSELVHSQGHNYAEGGTRTIQHAEPT